MNLINHNRQPISNYQHCLVDTVRPLLQSATDQALVQQAKSSCVTFELGYSEDADTFISRIVSSTSDPTDTIALVQGLLRSWVDAETQPPLLPQDYTPMSGRRDSCTDEPLVVAQFNVLADNLCGLHPSLGNFEGPAPECLDFAFRRWRIIEHILRIRPDVATFQEVDAHHFHGFFQPLLSHLGYHMVFRAKPSATCSYSPLRDGCMIISRWPLSGAWSWRLGMDANQVLVATEISFRDKPVLVATTHLKASKTAEGEKLRAQQVDVATDLLAALRSESAAPLLFCGDWNATAEQSEHAKYASKAVPATLAHEGLRLRSVYGQAEASKTLSDTVFTTCKTRAGYTITHAIDYIFVSPDVDISAVGSLPTCEMLPAWGLPNWDWPSDHLALCAWVRFPESKL